MTPRRIATLLAALVGTSVALGKALNRLNPADEGDRYLDIMHAEIAAYLTEHAAKEKS
jgi:hypothetical protein